MKIQFKRADAAVIDAQRDPIGTLLIDPPTNDLRTAMKPFVAPVPTQGVNTFNGIAQPVVYSLGPIGNKLFRAIRDIVHSHPETSSQLTVKHIYGYLADGVTSTASIGTTNITSGNWYPMAASMMLSDIKFIKLELSAYGAQPVKSELFPVIYDPTLLWGYAGNPIKAGKNKDVDVHDIAYDNQYNRILLLDKDGTHYGNKAGTIYYHELKGFKTPLLSISIPVRSYLRDSQKVDSLTIIRAGYKLYLKYVNIDGAPNSARYLILSRSGTSWGTYGEMQHPTALTTDPDTGYGVSISHDNGGSYVTVGAHLENGTGAVNAYHTNGNSVLYNYTLTNGLANSEFGYAQASGYSKVLLVGAPNANNGVGEVYVYNYDSTAKVFNLIQTIVPTVPGTNRFGHSICIDYYGKTALIGTSTDNNTIGYGMSITRPSPTVPFDSFQTVYTDEGTVADNSFSELSDFSYDGEAMVLIRPGEWAVMTANPHHADTGVKLLGDKIVTNQYKKLISSQRLEQGLILDKSTSTVKHIGG